MGGYQGEDLYFFEAAMSGRIKVGRTSDWRARLSSVQIGCPESLSCRLLVRGGGVLEAALHGYMEPEREHGEWFSLVPDSPLGCLMHGLPRGRMVEVSLPVFMAWAGIVLLRTDWEMRDMAVVEWIRHEAEEFATEKRARAALGTDALGVVAAMHPGLKRGGV